MVTEHFWFQIPGRGKVRTDHGIRTRFDESAKIQRSGIRNATNLLKELTQPQITFRLRKIQRRFRRAFSTSALANPSLAATS